jgi:hypothetical protein
MKKAKIFRKLIEYTESHYGLIECPQCNGFETKIFEIELDWNAVKSKGINITNLGDIWFECECGETFSHEFNA